jgi:hypothetical protein
MHTPKLFATSSLLILLTLAACGQGAATPTAVPTAAPTPPISMTEPPMPPATNTPVVIDHITPTPAPPTPTAGAAIGPITFSVTGGFAGISETLQLAPDGSMTLTNARPPATYTGTLTAAQQAELARLLAAVQDLTLQPIYTNGRVADDFSDTIRFTHGGQAVQVTIAETGGEGLTPPALEALRQFLHDLYKSLQFGPAPAASPTPASGKIAPLITYNVSGGFVGINQTLQILPDGRLIFINARGGDPGTGQITAAQLADLTRLIADAGALHPADRYGFPPAPDQFVDTLEFSYAGQPYTVTLAVDSGKAQWPPAILALDNFMQALYKGVQK